MHSVKGVSLWKHITFAKMIFHPPCYCLLPLYRRMLLKTFITRIYHQHLVSHTTIEFVTSVFKSPFPSFKTIANTLNNTCCFPSSNQLHIHKTLPLLPWQVCDCANSVTVAQVCLLRIQAGLWGMNFFTALSRPFPVYHIHAWASYFQNSDLPAALQISTETNLKFTNVTPLLPGNS